MLFPAAASGTATIGVRLAATSVPSTPPGAAVSSPPAFTGTFLWGSGLFFATAGAAHFGDFRRFGTRFFLRSDEGLPGPGDKQDEQEQDDKGRHDPPRHVHAASGSFARSS